MLLSVKTYRFAQIHCNADFLQDLLLYSVGALELEHSVLREDMLDDHNVVFSLLLSQLHRGAALEQLPILGKLRHLQQPMAPLKMMTTDCSLDTLLEQLTVSNCSIPADSDYSVIGGSM